MTLFLDTIVRVQEKKRKIGTRKKRGGGDFLMPSFGKWSDCVFDKKGKRKVAENRVGGVREKK